MMIALEELGIFQILLLKVEDKQNLTHPQSKSPINQLSGCGALFFLLTRLFSHSVKIGHIPIYIGIKFNFVLCELDVRRILSSHNSLLKLNCNIFRFASNMPAIIFGQPPFVNVSDRVLAIAKQPSISH